ncbi:MAG: ABC transporter permease [Spirochaetaceae bacterium]
MNNWIIFIGFRHFKTKRREKGDTSTLLSIIGILSGVMTMITVIGVMNGFQGSNIDKKIEISSAHIALEPISDTPIADEIIFKDYPEIKLFYKSSEFITAASDQWDSEMIGLQVISVPENIFNIDPIFKQWVKIFDGSFNISDNKSIIIGQSLAYHKNLGLGDKLNLLSLKSTTTSGYTPEQIDYTITGIFRTGSIDYDENVVFISNNSALEYFVNIQELIYKIKIDNRKKYEHLTNKLKENKEISKNYEVKNWTNYNTSYFNALKNEKDLMTVLIGLIFLVVGVNIYNSLRRSVYLRFEEISVLKTMGATSLQVRFIFILESLFIGLIGATIGVVLGLLIAFNINQIFGILEIIVNWILNIVNQSSVSFYGSQFFYINKVPVAVYFSECVMVYLSAVFTSIIAAYAASKRISTIKPGEVIRNE